MQKKILPSSAKYKNARLSLLLVLILSVINIVTTLAFEYYFLFSSYFSNTLIQVGYVFAYESGEQLYLIVATVLALVVLVPYLLCWIFSKKHVGWMIAALVLFSIDSLLLLTDLPVYIEYGDFSIILDVAIHAIVIVELSIGVKSGYDMKKEDQEAITTQPTDSAVFSELAATEAEGTTIFETRKITVTRKKSFAGCAVPLIVYVNGNEVCRLKNGASQTISAPASTFELGASLSNGLAVNKLTVPEGYGYDTPAYSMQIKMGFSAAKIVIERV